MSTYSLWAEPWIPVQASNGRMRKLSLPEALVRAHEIRGVVDPSPLITVALHRLMLAVVFRTHQLEKLDDWISLWRRGRFDETAIDAYGSVWAERFDLLHPRRPFYQVPFIHDEKVHPVAALALEAASGNNPALFDHGKVEGADELSLDRAACYLVAYQAFAIGGGVSKPFNRMDAPLTKGFIVEVSGRSLFETLALNAMTRSQWDEIAPVLGHDLPFWEVDDPPEPRREGTVVQGPLHYLTWQSRQVHLVVDRERKVVTGCQIRQRYCLPKDGTRVDPGKCYYQDEKTGWQPRRLQKDRAAWRMTHVLLLPATDRGDRLAVVSWLAALRQRASRFGTIELPTSVSLTVSGLTTDPKLAAKIDLWRREEIGLPLAILDDPESVRHVESLMEDAGWVERLLRRATVAMIWAISDRKNLGNAVTYLRMGKAGSAKVPPNVAEVARGIGVTVAYWGAMEAPFRTALMQLPERGFRPTRAEWHAQLQRHARQAFLAKLEAEQGYGAPWDVLSVIRDAFERQLARLPNLGLEVNDDDDSGDEYPRLD